MDYNNLHSSLETKYSNILKKTWLFKYSNFLDNIFQYNMYIPDILELFKIN